MFRVRVDVEVRVRVSNLLESDYGQCECRVIISVRAELELGLGLMFDPNNLLTLTIATQLTLKGHCIEFKYYADGIHVGLTPPG